MQKEYDVIIIGAGPIGLACAIEAKRKNLKYLVIEKGALVNSLYNYPLYMTFFSTSERLEIGDVPFTSISFKPGRQDALEYYRRIQQHFDLNIHLYEAVNSIELKDKLKFIKTNQSEYYSKNIIIATGFYDIPIYLNIPGENLPKVSHYYKEAHPYAGQKVVVVGANNSSVDAALECWRKGADVTMVIRKGEIHERVKYWVKPDVENRISEGSIKAYFHSNLKEIKEKSVTISTSDGEIEIENDFVLALTGYRPNFEFLESCGINLSKNGRFIPKYNPETMESNVKGIYLAGVVCGGMETHKWFIENSRVHAKMILEDIFAKSI
ncbi:YpdA family putative bacillithiol disulfide reductase [Moheibacter lacus]|uniref:YpdA family putative bacillithiol disulfide reductase n=1 Tax=Moheibacter lacus TaxID=2745851 RepID=A0A838ZU42_9FLAO|nr:YpdA family putative bacillithiol disulfide reductase [Moheibacter lacus]MBA5630481.1 YpdA family putative bacillithiol disulfide reductase [Moheibacter lacus]